MFKMKYSRPLIVTSGISAMSCPVALDSWMQMLLRRGLMPDESGDVPMNRKTTIADSSSNHCLTSVAILAMIEVFPQPDSPYNTTPCLSCSTKVFFEASRNVLRPWNDLHFFWQKDPCWKSSSANESRESDVSFSLIPLSIM